MRIQAIRRCPRQCARAAVIAWAAGLFCSALLACSTSPADSNSTDAAADSQANDTAAPPKDAPASEVATAKDAPTDAPAEVSPGGADALPLDTATAPPLTAGVCFADLPQPGTFTGDVPMPTAECPDLITPEWYLDQPVPAPTLTVVLGRRDAAGQWLPIQTGDWVALETAMQGGFHLELVPKILLPGKTEPKVLLQAEAFAAVECNPVAGLNLAKAWLVRLPGAEPWYTFETTAKPLVIFGVSVAKKAQFCGLWVKTHWRLRIPGSAQWGEAVHTLRTYDGTKLP